MASVNFYNHDGKPIRAKIKRANSVVWLNLEVYGEDEINIFLPNNFVLSDHLHSHLVEVFNDLARETEKFNESNPR